MLDTWFYYFDGYNIENMLTKCNVVKVIFLSKHVHHIYVCAWTL